MFGLLSYAAHLNDSLFYESTLIFNERTITKDSNERKFHHTFSLKSNHIFLMNSRFIALHHNIEKVPWTKWNSWKVRNSICLCTELFITCLLNVSLCVHEQSHSMLILCHPQNICRIGGFIAILAIQSQKSTSLKITVSVMHCTASNAHFIEFIPQSCCLHVMSSQIRQNKELTKIPTSNDTLFFWMKNETTNNNDNKIRQR